MFTGNLLGQVEGGLGQGVGGIKILSRVGVSKLKICFCQVQGFCIEIRRYKFDYFIEK